MSQWQENGFEYRTIEGTLKRVSDPQVYQQRGGGGQRRVVNDYYHLGIKTPAGERVMVYVTTAALGWGGNLRRSKVWYRNPRDGKNVKTSMANPTRFVGKRMKVTGAWQVLNEPKKKYRMNRVRKIVLLLK